MKWNNYWDQLLVNGVIPFIVLALANLRICMSVAKSENTRNALLEGTSPETIRLEEMDLPQRRITNKYLKRTSSNSDLKTELSPMKASISRQQSSMLKKRREKSTLILSAIVLLFIFCQSLRLIFKMIEIGLIEDHISYEVFTFCDGHGRHGVPAYLLCMSHFNHILLVINSAINFFLYCWVARRFRLELKSLLKSCLCL